MKTRIFLSAALIVIAGPAGAGSSQRLSEANVAALQRWVDAVLTHIPGQLDQPVVETGSLTYQERSELNDGMEFFQTILVDGGGRVHGDIARRVASLAFELQRRPGASQFLKRAAVFHADAAIAGRRFPAAHTGRPSAGTRPPRPAAGAEHVPPLLSERPLLVDRDGEVVGDTLANWNWPFARSLLALLPHRAADPFVAEWYHATTAFQFANGLYGEANEHLADAAEVLPDDPRVLFDRACFAEILGLPMHQMLLADPASLAGVKLTIPRVDATNAEAERLFRRAIDIDPWFTEARVRLARVLDFRGAHLEALAGLNTALGATRAGVVAFYAHLFAGRASLAAGKIDDAARHYAQASELFPNAQSALLGLSQTRLMGAEVEAALEPVQRLGPFTAMMDADPWWSYQLGAGRDAVALLRDLWAHTPPSR